MRAQQPQRVRHTRLRLARRRREVTDAQLAALEQRHQQPQPARIGQQPEHIRHIHHVRVHREG